MKHEKAHEHDKDMKVTEEKSQQKITPKEETVSTEKPIVTPETEKKSGDESSVTVWVRPWALTVTYRKGEPELEQTETAEDIDLEKIKKHIAGIWGNVNVKLHYHPTAKAAISMAKLPAEYASDDEFNIELNAQMNPILNSTREQDSPSGKTGIQVVFIPTYDRWGFTYYPNGRKGGYTVPVTFVATRSAGVGVNVERGEKRIDSSSIKDHVPLDIILDAAHEIGHAFGLEHVEKPDEAGLLMHKALYHTVGNAAKMTEEGARKLFTEKFEKNGVTGVYKREGEVGATPKGMMWTAMHGAGLSKEQIELVMNNIRSKKYLEGK